MIRFTCPICGSSLKVGDDAAGKTAKCPQCAELLKVPPQSIDQSEHRITAAEDQHKNCLHCRYWVGSEINEKDACKRYPPLLAAMSEQTRGLEDAVDGVWPETYGRDWCGEFLPKS